MFNKAARWTRDMWRSKTGSKSSEQEGRETNHRKEKE